MPLKTEKEPLNVVDIASSDEEGGAKTVATKKVSSITAQPTPLQISGLETSQGSEAIMPPLLPFNETLESRSFWKAGNYAVGPTSKPALLQGSLEHARVHPKFLHSNATSHKWAFGAIAELMDNAVDEIHHGATFIKVDKIDVMKDNSPGPALLFQDDGGGMDPELIRKCMSLGYSSKKSNTTIGQYGNGFKTSTMRLGADVIVFSRSTSASKATQSVGLLSYTFLCRTGQDDVIVPMIDFDISGHWAEPIIYSSQDDWSSNLKTILEWSPFSSKEELMLQFDDIGPHGTKIVIYNLWLNDEGIYELAFDDDDEDIRLRDEALHGATKLHKKTVELQSHISYRIRYSLRAYASILYLRKFNNFEIILKGKPVQQFNIADELKYPKVVTYKPQVAAGPKEWSVATTIGFIKEAPSLGVSGFNVYHKNRLIRPFWKVTSDGSSKGNGVVGVLEADFIEPAHDKQDFERSSLFVRLETRLKQMVYDYWKSHCHLVGYQPPGMHAANMKKQSSAYQHNSSSNLQAESDEQSIRIPANGEQDLRNEQPGLEVPNEVMSKDDVGSISIDQLCEENILLFRRCEEHKQKEAELKQTIVELEKELEDMRNKCAQLSSHLEAKRKLKVI
ncbi:protein MICRORCHIDIA 2-like isoform X1 [Durio zibethinus]|uniref:Protein MICRORCHIDIA 2-like isoform X1 n=1 Tax=Durio zibethinus TaxID=66656 RepID=A0A6P5YJ26_DURZI|nr:protein MICRORCHIDIA 2-like isoform X1 [Durio zibethinus]